ncbi:MAG: efflux RND transporter permease subunit [Deltaproteobacteria bacterium]|nr:efflux RND transporter permease subunit [Deltaproteobacteria bacterium]
MIRWLVNRSLTVAVAMVAVVLFGVWAWYTLPREAAPDITIPVVMITTPYPGVSPEDVEGLLSIPLEGELASLRDVKVMRSVSMEGVSLVSIEFEPDVVMEDALQKVRDRVNRVRPTLPSDAQEPEIREISFSDVPILLVDIGGAADEEVLKELGESLKEEVARVPGVLDAKLAGGLEREIRVEVDPWRLAHYALGMGDVITAIQRENSNVPGGEVAAGASTFLVRVPGEITRAAQLEDVAVVTRGDHQVFIRDVARVVDGYAERQTYARMNGQPVVSLSVTKRAGANIIEVAKEVKRLAAEHSEAWPEGVSYKIVNDQSLRIEDMVFELQNSILTALVLVVGVILLFMGARNALFVAISIPSSFLLSMMVLQALGFTLNMIVLFALIMALGMLVDNAIVVVENVYRHLEMGKSKVEAAIEGTREMAIPVATSTATTVAAFLPLVFWTGIMGKFMGFLPKTIIIVLLASLVVAIGVLPVVLARGVKGSFAKKVDGGSRWMRAYKAVLEASIRFRYLSLGAGAVSFVVTVVVFALFNHGVEFFPATDPDRATVAVELSQGEDLDATDRVVRQVEAILAQEPNVAFFVAEPGVQGGGNALLGAQRAPNKARVSIEFLPHKASAKPGERVRVESTLLTVDRIRDRVEQIPGARFQVEKEKMGPPVGKPIEVKVTGPSYHEVGHAALIVRRAMEEVEGAADLTDDYQVGRPELRLQVDRGAAKRVGLSSGQIGDAVRTAVAGKVASTLREGEDETDIVVRLAPEYRDNLQSVLDLRLPGREDRSPDTFSVPLSSVASYELLGGTGAIHHQDQDLVVTIGGDVVDGANENEVRARVQAVIDGLALPAGIHTSMGGSQEAQQDAAAFLGRAFVIAVVLILMVLVAQFNSIALPFIILASVILSLVGVLWGLLLTGTPFGIIMTGLGVISLAGVVVNNAIVLLDTVEQLQKDGASVHDALMQAGVTRFRPVMLTAVTTVLGLVPMAIGLSIDFSRLRVVMGSSSGQWWGPMAVAVIFGLAFATVLTLVLVPTMYSIYDDLRRLPARLTGRRAAKAAVSLAGLLLVVPQARAVDLDGAMAAAEGHDLSLAMLSEQTIQTQALTGKAWSLLSPRVTLSGAYNLNQYESKLDMSAMLPPELAGMAGDGEPIVIQPKHYVQGSVTVSQSLFSGTAIPGLQAAYAMSRGAELDEAWQRSRARAGVVQVYWSLWTAREAVRLSSKAVENAQEHLELARAQWDAGLAPRRAVLQGELALARADRERQAALTRVVEVEEMWFRLTGLPRDEALEEPTPVVVDLGLEQALAAAPLDRSDLAAASERVRAARLQSLAYDLDWLPSLDASWTEVYTENTGFLGQNTFWTASLSATWRLWDGGMRLANQREAASRARAARYAEEAAQRSVTEELRGAWERLQRAESGLKAAQREVDLATENLALAEEGQAAGSVTFLEVDEAALGLQSAELTLLNERMNRELAAVAVLVASGLW